MDHLAEAKEWVEPVQGEAAVSELACKNAIAHALIALVERLDKLTACVEPDSRLFRTKPFDIR